MRYTLSHLSPPNLSTRRNKKTRRRAKDAGIAVVPSAPFSTTSPSSTSLLKKSVLSSVSALFPSTANSTKYVKSALICESSIIPQLRTLLGLHDRRPPPRHFVRVQRLPRILDLLDCLNLPVRYLQNSYSCCYYLWRRHSTPSRARTLHEVLWK